MTTNNFSGVDADADNPSSWDLGHVLLATEDGTNSADILSGSVVGKTFTNSQLISGGATFTCSSGFVNNGTVATATINANTSGDGTYTGGSTVVNGDFFSNAGTIGGGLLTVNGNMNLGAQCVLNSFSALFDPSGEGGQSIIPFGGFQADMSQVANLGILYNVIGAQLAGIGATPLFPTISPTASPAAG